MGGRKAIGASGDPCNIIGRELTSGRWTTGTLERCALLWTIFGERGRVGGICMGEIIMGEQRSTQF